MTKIYSTFLITLILTCLYRPFMTLGRSLRPNIIIILTDDQGYGDVGCYGNEAIRTPYLDQMASQGMRFTNFYMAASVCTPSRAALMTGCYPQRVGLPKVLFPNSMSRGQKDGYAIGLNTDEITMAELLKSAGYKTACIGKWHLGDLPEFMPLNHGFDVYFGLPYSNDMMPGATPHNFDSLPLFEGDSVIEFNPDQDLLIQHYTDRALSFIEDNKKNPFFLYLAHNMPHRPVHVVDSLVNLRFSKEQLSKITGENKESRDFLYPAAIEELDLSVGTILRKLEELDLENNTLVIFTSDNGPAVGSSGPLRGGKGSMYEGGLRVPCIMQWKGVIPVNKVCDNIASAIDLYPTIATLAGVDLPEDRTIDGIDISELLFKVKAEEPREQFFYLDQDRGLKAVRNGSWKLFIGKEPQLYNLEDDIGEQNNLFDKEKDFVEKLAEMAVLFEEEMKNNHRSPGLIPLKDLHNNFNQK